MGKTIKERIVRFCEKYPEPRQYKIKLRWTRKDGLHEQVVGSGEELKFNDYYKTMHYRTVGKDYYIQHYRYDKETELMECSYAVIDCHTPKKDDDRRWKYAERYFIPKEEKKVYDVLGNVNFYVLHSTYNTYTSEARYFLQAFARLDCKKETFYEAFMALTDNSPSLPPRYSGSGSLHYPWILTEWIRYNAKPRNLENSKTQKRIDKMLAKELDNIQYVKKKILDYINNDKSRSEYYNYYRYSSHAYAYFDKANMVFRLFNLHGDEMTEEKRVYIDGKKFLFAGNKNGKWVTNGSFTSSQFYHTIVNIEDVYSLPYCKYLENFKAKSVYKIVSIMRNPEIEQLCNMGFENLAQRCTNNGSVASELKYIFGEPDKKKRNVCQRYHLTRNQLAFVNSSNTRSYYDAVVKMKQILNTNDLSSVDIESFKKYYNAISGSYHFGMFNNMNQEDKKKIFLRIVNMMDKHSNAMQVFYDTWSMSRRFNIDIMNIHSYDELVRAHDTAIRLQNIEREERQRLWAMSEKERNKELEKKMAKIDKEREKFNYEEENFLIRLPANLAEIVSEGSALHHCVGGYTSNHASGATTILFLRRKNEPEKPFYTIEVRSGHIVQIHGFGNRWLGCNPEAIPTVARWLKKNNIYCSDQILRSTATGYGGNNNLVPMPAI